MLLSLLNTVLATIAFPVSAPAIYALLAIGFI
jgi:hypothetical protein